MPVTTSYPGVYVNEVPSQVRTIPGVPTSKTAFVGFAPRGPVDRAVEVAGAAEFDRIFGGLWVKSLLGYAVHHFFQNGGGEAIVVRAVRTGDGGNDAVPARLSLVTDGGTLTLAAASPGLWGNTLAATMDSRTRTPGPGETLFNLAVKDTATGQQEEFRNLSPDPLHKRYAPKVLLEESALAVVEGAVPQAPFSSGGSEFASANDGQGSDGQPPRDTDLTGESTSSARRGLRLLEETDLFNLLVIPPPGRAEDFSSNTHVWTKALELCHDRRAMFLVDPPVAWGTVEAAQNGMASLPLHENAMVYFPRLLMPDPLKEGRLEAFPPAGAVAGVIARTDGARGFWKAPAGQEANLRGVAGLTVRLTDHQNGQLNPLGVNCLRSFPDSGRVVWGARTLRGSDRLASEWKYIPVRRTALNIEESLYRGTQWVVFEPNDERLWAQIRLNVGQFMHGLFRQGAFQGVSPREAYFVKCDGETTTQDDINRGIVNIHVGFAPLKPAEFVVIHISQMAGGLAP